jgi:hypothetical protein
MGRAMSVTPLRKKTDPTAAERARRYRKRKKEDAAVTAPPVTMPAVTVQHDGGGVTAFTLAAALALATVSGTFSIIGLTNVFAGAFWPVIGMGVAIEMGKIAGVAWLGRQHTAPIQIRFAVVTLVGMLMVLNMVGAYGFLAAAHIGHAVAGEAAISARLADVDGRKRLQAAALADIDRRIGQIDAAVAETIRRGRGAAALALVAQQASSRDALVTARLREAKKLAEIEIEAAAVAGERAKVEADFGPVRYLAALLGAEDEAVMRLFILLVACLLDPLAIVLLAASTVTTRRVS